jgi:cation:H+ antiporter
MDLVFSIVGFIGAIIILSWLSSRLVATLTSIAKYLHWREFIIAFFVMAFAASLPNLFVDINATLHGMPEIAFGDVVGGNLVDLTLVLAIAVLFGSKSLPAESEMVQKSALFTAGITILPILLVYDKRLDRIDGVILLGVFALYTWWLFSKEDRFKKVYESEQKSTAKSYFGFLLNIVKIIVFLALLLATSFFIINFAQFFSVQLGISLSLVGILIVGLGNCFPEIYFSIISAKKGENWMILGDLMGSVIICATLVLGIIAIISPFEILDFSPFAITRIFTIIAALLFVILIRTGKEFTKFEGLVFLAVYVLFLLVQVFIPDINQIILK